MNLPWHVMRKDARRMWLPLTTWACLIASQHTVEWVLHHLPVGDKARIDWFRGVAIALFALRLGVGYVLAAGIVMEDPASGTTAFWKSRPISGAGMFGAKILGCGVLLVAVPMLLELPWWLAGSGGMGPGRYSFAFTLQWQAVVVAAGAFAAAFSATVGRFLGWTVGLQLVSLAGLSIFAGRNSPAPAAVVAAFRAAPLQIAGAGSLAVLACAVAMLARYQRRSPRYVYSILAVGATAGAVLLLQVLG